METPLSLPHGQILMMPSPLARSHFHPQQGHLDHNQLSIMIFLQVSKNMQNLLQMTFSG